MKMSWYVPQQHLGRPVAATARGAQSRKINISAYADFNSSISDLDDRSIDFQVDSAEDEETRSGGRQRVLVGRISSKWVILIPLVIRIDRDDGRIIASDDEFAVHGDGETEQAAIRDYIASLLEYYDLLSVRALEDKHTMVLFRRLKDYLKKVAD
jgi:hypothetical protein